MADLTETLTAEQVKHTRVAHGHVELNTLIDGGRLCYIRDLCDSHEALRAELSRLRLALADMATERDTLKQHGEFQDAVINEIRASALHATAVACERRATAAEAALGARERELAEMTEACRLAVRDCMREQECRVANQDVIRRITHCEKCGEFRGHGHEERCAAS